MVTIVWARGFLVRLACALLIASSALRSETPGVIIHEPLEPEVARVTGDVVNVRNVPSSGGVVIDSVKQGDLVKLIDYSDSQSTIDGQTFSWFKVQLKNKRVGWVFGAYLQRDPVASARTEKELTDAIAAEAEWKIKPSSYPRLIRAIWQSNVEGLALFISLKDNVNVEGPGQWERPLSVAIRQPKGAAATMAFMLLKAGADAKAREGNLKTALMSLGELTSGAMSDSDRKKLADALIKAGVDVNARDTQGRTALMTAYHRPVLEALLAAKADLKIFDNNGMTALHHAAQNDNVGKIKMLLDAGADVNAAVSGGSTPLMEAARYGRASAVQTLIELRGSRFFGGLDVNARDRQGLTALALGSRYPEIVRLLKAAGAK